MSKKYEALHVGYVRHRGQVPTFGGSPEIANALESLGTGMEVSSPWERGGPIVWRPTKERRLVGWMRGIPAADVDRQGAWECWGLLVADDVDISAWPWLWKKMLQSNTEGSLDELGQRLLKKQGDSAPDQAGELTTVLTALHRQRRAGADPPMTIPMNTPMHATALVPWVWLLGPFDPQEAFLGPPRKNPAAASPALIYHATIGAPLAPIQIPRFLDSVKEKTSLESAIQFGERLRAMTDWFPQAVEAPPAQATPFFRSEVYESDDGKEISPTTSEGISWHTKLLTPFRANWNWLPMLPWALTLLLLVYIALRVGPMSDGIIDIRNTVHAASSQSTKPVSGKSAPGTLGMATATPTATETATTTRSVTANTAQPAADVFREMITRGVPGVTFAPKIKTIAQKRALTDDEQTKLHIAALQTVFVKRGWATGKPIDGSAGSGFFAAIKKAGSGSDVGRLLTDDQYLVVELQKR
ncbi:MAG TPA: hypothetical protein VGQ46_20195 [Thermoanaerobaculia bacterium]|jgi:hypothetical protein|nr:hypothetical protein [Thermoanaerobaculia bacterium]